MDNNDKVKTRLVYETENDRYIWESPYMDVDMQDILDALFGMLVSATWHPTTIINAMQDFVCEHNDMLDSDEPDYGFDDKGDEGDDECKTEFEKDVEDEPASTKTRQSKIAEAPKFFA